MLLMFSLKPIGSIFVEQKVAQIQSDLKDVSLLSFFPHYLSYQEGSPEGC